MNGEEAGLASVPKYRHFVAAVDKALKSFENTEEWADLIAALTKLSKDTNPHRPSLVPKPVMVAKRLSQCLHPALPSGVHLRAIDCYRQIFFILGDQGLMKVLHVFSIGIFPLIGVSQIKVKWELLSLVREWVVPLGQEARPAVVALLSALLPAMEEGTEFYEPVAALLHILSEGVGPTFFYTGLWAATLASPGVRLPAMLFLYSRYDRAKPLDDQLHLLGSNPDFMVSALCIAARDEQILAQRSVLDFLLAAFPLQSQLLVDEDKRRLLWACLFVVLRRDMSLNRRLYNWLLGAPVGGRHDPAPDLAYFRLHSLPHLVAAIKGRLADKETSPADLVRLCRARASLSTGQAGRGRAAPGPDSHPASPLLSSSSNGVSRNFGGCRRSQGTAAALSGFGSYLGLDVRREWL